MDNKPVLILENSNHLLESKNTGNPNDKYVLEGIFAEFGVENNNGRIYESGEYIPHLTYLNEKIKDNKLVGELDHPENFEVSLKNVSHLIENLTYDEKTKTVKGRLRLLDTPNGKQAKALIDGGVKLSISSRAAGVVESNKTVKIKKIFTYDLVADPGFSSAGLNRINESLGITNDNIAIYEINDAMINSVTSDEVKSVLLDLKKITTNLNTNENKTEYIDKELNDKKMDNEKTQDKNYVTINDLNKYTQVVKEGYTTLKNEVENLKKEIETKSIDNTQKISENLNNPEITMLNEKLDNVIKFLNYVTDNFNKQEKRISSSIKFQKELAENVDDSIAYTEEIAKKMNEDFSSVQEYMSYIGKEADKIITFTNYVAENLDMSIQHQDHIATKLNEAINYANYLAKGQDKIIEYNNYQTRQIDKAISHQDYIAENLNDAMNYMQYTANELNNTINYTEYVGKKSLPHLPNKKTNVNESLSNRIDKLINAVENQKTATTDKTSGISMLSESNKQRFDGLSFTEKQKVVDALKGNQYINEKQVLEAWKSALGEDKLEESLFAHMPKEVKPVWESLSDEQKSVIRTRSTYWDLSTPYKIRTFWNSQGLVQQQEGISLVSENVKKSDFYKKINEQAKSNDISIVLGYSKDSIAKVAEQLSSRKNS